MKENEKIISLNVFLGEEVSKKSESEIKKIHHNAVKEQIKAMVEHYKRKKENGS